MSFKSKLAIFALAIALSIVGFNLIACGSCCDDLFRLAESNKSSVSVKVISLRVGTEIIT
jgi:hypothetical protein